MNKPRDFEDGTVEQEEVVAGQSDARTSDKDSGEARGSTFWRDKVTVKARKCLSYRRKNNDARVT